MISFQILTCGGAVIFMDSFMSFVAEPSVDSMGGIVIGFLSFSVGCILSANGN